MRVFFGGWVGWLIGFEFFVWFLLFGVFSPGK